MRYLRIEPGKGHEAGRSLLSQMVLEQTGAPMPQILVGERGKPYFAEGDLHFSISHTKHHVFCVLRPHPVGIDAEEKDRSIDLRLADKILSPTEKAQYEKAPDKQEALLKFWVLKEAAGKCSGQGINGYPNKTDFSLQDPRLTEVDGCFVAIIEEKDHVI